MFYNAIPHISPTIMWLRIETMNSLKSRYDVTIYNVVYLYPWVISYRTLHVHQNLGTLKCYT